MFSVQQLGIIASVMEAKYGELFHMFSRCPKEFMGSGAQQAVRDIVKEAVNLERAIRNNTLVVMEWKTGIPPRDGWYLVSVEEASEPILSMFRKGHWIDEYDMLMNITAWMEVPEAYKEASHVK